MTEYRWIELGNGRSVYRKIKERLPVAKSDFATPMLIGDFSEPVQSMADGKWYGSKRALSASHRASGNPNGIDFIELGDDNMDWVEHKPSEEKRERDIRDALEDVKSGNLPEILSLDN